MSNVQAGTVMVDRYRLTRPTPTDLAAAEAWQAQDQILDRAVRVTFVSGQYAASALDAARRAALVSDPRLCRVLDVGTTDLGDGERSYVITEPYAGESLTQIVSRGLVDAQQAKALMGEAATALEAARQRGVHHLALRPEAVRVDGHRVVVTGLGIDAGLAGIESSQVDPGSTDARGIVALGYYALTARWPAENLEAPWIAADAVRPLPAQAGSDGEGVVPVSALVPHVDEQVDALVRRTFGAGDDVPSSPADIISALEPWGQVSVMAALPQFVQPAPERPVRASVLGAGSAPGAESRPGTPPPAPPVRRPSTGRIARAGAVGAVAGAGVAYGQQTAAYGQAPVAAQHVPAQPGYGQAAATQHAPVPPPPAQGYAAGGYAQQSGSPAQAPTATMPPSSNSPTSGSFTSTAAPRRRGVNPTPIVLGLILVAVVLAGVWAVLQVVRPFEPVSAPPVAETSQEPADEGAGDDDESADEDAPAEEETPDVRPIIETGSEAMLSGEGDKPEKVELAYDSDPSTFWHTYTYNNNPVFGGLKEGLGFDVQLRDTAPVSRVDLDTNSEGGAWELRKTTADDPSGGDVLASGTFSDETAIELEEPVILDEFVLWITELPSVGNSQYRVEINEITLS